MSEERTTSKVDERRIERGESDGNGGSDEKTESTESTETPATDWTPVLLTTVRTDRRRRLVALVLAALVGLGFAWVHWLGLFAAGALVGLVSKTLPRALVAGAVLGVFVLVAHVFISPVMNASEFVALTPASYVTVAAGVLAPTWGSLIRGVL